MLARVENVREQEEENGGPQEESSEFSTLTTVGANDVYSTPKHLLV